MSCGAPVKNGTQRTNNQYCNTVGCYANFICAVGYENFVGDTSRYCEMDGNWTGIEPSCESKHFYLCIHISEVVFTFYLLLT